MTGSKDSLDSHLDEARAAEPRHDSEVALGTASTASSVVRGFDDVRFPGAALLIGRCDHHHRFVHEHGYRIELDELRQPRCFDQRDRLVTESAARPIMPWVDMNLLVDDHSDPDISAETNEPRWDGYPVNDGWVIDDLVRVDRLQ